MEVHHHPQTERKKWTHYLWEFLMLFLAVFSGFLAENIREHNVEKERGLQYIHSFKEDLKTDTVQYSLIIDELTKKKVVLNNIFTCFDSITDNIKSTECLKEIILNSRGFTDFIYTDRTIQQLKYAGGLRLIQDKEINDSIISYDALVRSMQIHQDVLENQQQISINAHCSMIDFISLCKNNNTDSNHKLFILTKDNRELNKYFSEIFMFGRGCSQQLRLMKELKAKASRLILFLNKKTESL